MLSRVRQNFHQECEANINKQINMELTASYGYLALADYFDRSDVALVHAKEFFRAASHEEKEHAETLINYMNQRGGIVCYRAIESPDISSVKSLLDAMKLALEWERNVNDKLLKLYAVAKSHGDAQMCHFIASVYLREQVEASKQLGDFISELERCGDGMGEYIFDKITMKKVNKIHGK